MATLVEPGNSTPLGKPTPNSSASRENDIINRTKELGFPTEAILPLENFDHHGDRPAGFQNSVSDMEKLSGKELQESYRVSMPRDAASYTDKVSDR